MKKNSIDIHVGSKIRELRRIRGMNQKDLAYRMGLTFQQVQKYEKGCNRIILSKLCDISMILRFPIYRFLEGLTSINYSCENAFPLSFEGGNLSDSQDTHHIDDDIINYDDGRMILSLVKNFKKIPSIKTKKAIQALVSALASELDSSD